MNVRRGMRRVGTFLSVPLAICGVVLLAISIWEYVSIWSSSASDPWKDFRAVENPYHNANVTLLMSLAWLMAAIVVYAAASSIGWVIDGFRRDN